MADSSQNLPLDARTTEKSDSPAVSDTERLVGALQTCFSELLKTQKEQTEKLHRAVEALQPKPPIADKKTVFWKQYQTLADEHDKELLQKFGTDLDTSLIFVRVLEACLTLGLIGILTKAGLFSAVSSAFIIQIQPQIHPEGTLTVIIVAQCLLVFSLFSTLLAALLAVLGKQWLMYYSAAGERGTIESRGLERQRKFDGLQRWKFDTVMQMFPLLLQLSLFLFSAALSVYLWTVHISLAIIVLLSTSGGFLAYVFLLMTSLVSPDSPFQNPIAPFLTMFISLTLLVRAKEYLARALTKSGRHVERGWSRISPPKLPHLLPYFSRRGLSTPPPQEELVPLFRGTFPDTSPEAPAIAWVLETSTDPLVITSAAELAVDLQWPIDMDLAAPLARLRDGFVACFVFATVGYERVVRRTRTGLLAPLERVRAGMTLRAITYGRAYCILRIAHTGNGSITDDDWALEVVNHIHSAESPELLNVVSILQGRPHLAVGVGVDTASTVRWALRVIPSLHRKTDNKLVEFLQGFHETSTVIPHLDASSFADYLFCLNSFLGPTNRRDMAMIDKSPIKDLLMCQFFSALSSRLKAGNIELELLTRALETTTRLATAFEGSDWYDFRLKTTEPTKERKTAAYVLCSLLMSRSPGWTLTDIVPAISAAAQLASIDISSLYIFSGRGDLGVLGTAEWVHRSLEQLQEQFHDSDNPTRGPWDSAAMFWVEGLIQALLYYPGDHTEGLPAASFRALLRAMSTPGTLSRTAFLFLSRSRTWLGDARLWPLIQQSELWLDLGRTTLHGPEKFRDDYIDMGHALAKIPHWAPLIHADLPGWLKAWLHRPTREPGQLEKIVSVISSLWVPEKTEHSFENEYAQATGLAFSALANVWTAFDFGSLPEFFPLARCTRDIALRETRDGSDDVLPGLQAKFLTPLSTALLRAAENARAMCRTRDSDDAAARNESVLREASAILEQLAQTILTGSHYEMGNLYWRLGDTIDNLERSLVVGTHVEAPLTY